MQMISDGKEISSPIFLQSIFSWSDDESDLDGGVDEEVITTNSITGAATSRTTVSPAKYVIGACIAASVTIILEIFDATFALVATRTIADSNYLLIPYSFSRFDNRRILRALQSAHLINALS